MTLLTRLLLLTVLLCQGLAVNGMPLNSVIERNDNGPWVVRVHELIPAEYGPLQTRFDVWATDSNDAYAIIRIRNRYELDQLRKLGHTARVDPISTTQLRTLDRALTGSGSIPGFACYRTVEATLSTAEAIVSNLPDIAELIDIGDSWEKTDDANAGFDLRVLRLTNRNIAGPKPVLFVMSAVHAREYTTAETMTRFAEELADGYGNNADATWLLDHHEIHLLLQSNPDGRKQAETGLSWRKNTNENYCSPTSESRGADLNRNFPFQWGGAASTFECDITYQGPSAASEPEVVAIVDYVRSIFPDQRGDGINDPAPLDASGVFIDVHSFSQLVLWPWGFSNNAGQAPNQDQLSTLGRRLAFFNSYRPQQILGLTAASGSTADFAYGELGVASYAFELGTSFFQNCTTFENDIVLQNIAAMNYAARVARTPYQTPSGPDITDLTITPNTIFTGDPVSITLTADGTRFSTLTDPTSPLESPREISTVEIHLDALPWQDPATTSASADDGSFDSSLEPASAMLTTAGLAEGRHTVYARATGTDAQAGAITGGFLYVLNPATAATLSGTVRVAGSSTTVANALIQAGPFMTVSDALGNYALNLSAGSYDITVSADGFGDGSASVTLAASEEQTLNLELIPRCDVFADNMENGNIGWQEESPWSIINDAAIGPGMYWHDSPGGNYASGLDISLTSPVIDLSQANNARLSFDHICDTESGFDFGIVETSADGNSWSEIYRCDDQESWQTQVLDLSSLDGEPTAQIRFRLDTDSIINDDGWYIDNVAINAAGGVCTTSSGDNLFSDGFESAQP